MILDILWKKLNKFIQQKEYIITGNTLDQYNILPSEDDPIIVLDNLYT